MEENGLYRYEPSLGKRARLLGCVLGPASREELAKADSIFGKLIYLLDILGLTPLLPGHMGVPPSLETVLIAAEEQQSHGVVLFGTRETAWMQGIARREFFERRAPPLAHRAMHWIDLSRFDADNVDFYALANAALALCAKLGHTPYVLASEAADDADVGRAPKRLVCSIDVRPMCRMDGAMRMATGMKLRCPNGEVEGSWSFEEPVGGQDLSSLYWRSALSPEKCAGRQVAIHREGRFTDAERQFLAGHAAEAGVAGSRFDLVEIEPSACMQDLEVEGSFRRLSECEGTLRAHGSQPLLIRVDGSDPRALENAAAEVFRLSTVDHGAIWSDVLAASSHSADISSLLLASRLTYNADMAWRSGSQQHWL